MPPVEMSFTYSLSVEGLVYVAGGTDNDEEAVYNVDEDAFRARDTCFDAFRARAGHSFFIVLGSFGNLNDSFREEGISERHSNGRHVDAATAEKKSWIKTLELGIFSILIEVGIHQPAIPAYVDGCEHELYILE